MRKYFLIALISVCAFCSEAQTLTRTYIDLVEEADRYMKAKKWEDAENSIIKALRHEPANRSNWLLWSNLGVVRTHRGNLEGAIQAYEIGLSGAPRSTVLLNNRAWTLMDAGNSIEALDDLNLSLQVDSLQVWPLKMRGLLKMADSKYDEALYDLTIADSLSKNDITVITAIGDLESLSGNKDKAIVRYREAMALEPDADTAFKLFLLLSDSNGMEKEAENLISDCMTRWPRNGKIHLAKAIIYKGKFQNDSAEAEKKLAEKYGVEPILINSYLGQKNP